MHSPHCESESQKILRHSAEARASPDPEMPFVISAATTASFTSDSSSQSFYPRTFIHNLRCLRKHFPGQPRGSSPLQDVVQPLKQPADSPQSNNPELYILQLGDQRLRRKAREAHYQSNRDEQYSSRLKTHPTQTRSNSSRTSVYCRRTFPRRT